MRAAVIGTGWGRVHVAALQRLGVEVVAVCGTDLARTEQVARECGVGVALDDVDRLPSLRLDLITIAAPTALHAELVARLGPTPLLCEKPAVGVESPVDAAPQPSGPVWVNYAFPFLDVVAQAERLLAGLVGTRTDAAWASCDVSSARMSAGVNDAAEQCSASGSAYTDAPEASAATDGPISVSIVSRHDLVSRTEADRSAWQWLVDVASHPWSWAIARFGEPAAYIRGRLTDDGGAQLTYQSAAGASVAVAAVPAPGIGGLQHEVVVNMAGQTVRFGGAFSVGSDWVFGPVHLNGRPLVSAQDADAPHADPWFLANVAAIEAVVQTLRGETRGRAPYTWQQALALDSCVQHATKINPSGR